MVNFFKTILVQVSKSVPIIARLSMYSTQIEVISWYSFFFFQIAAEIMFSSNFVLVFNANRSIFQSKKNPVEIFEKYSQNHSIFRRNKIEKLN